MCNQVLILQFALPIIAKIFWHVSRSRRSRLSSIRNETENIFNAIQSGNLLRATLIYDNSISPPSYGDFINVIMIARVLAAYQVDVKLVLTKTDYYSFYPDRFTTDELNDFIGEEIVIAKTLVQGVTIELCSSQELGELINGDAIDGRYVVFHEIVKSGTPFYYLAFNLTKSLLKKSSCETKNRVLFARHSSFVSNQRGPQVQYVAFACRWNESWGQYRNMSAELFINLSKILKNAFPNHELLVVSDRIGCDHFRSIALDHQLTCSFSKDYSDSFLGDATLVLNSEAWVQIRGGGIGIVPLWSDMPFLYFGRISSEQALLSKRTSQLNKLNQRFFVDYGAPSKHRLMKWLGFLALSIKN